MYEVTGQRALVTGNSEGGFLVTSALWTSYLGGKQATSRWLPTIPELPRQNLRG
jgi:hypothetical protein